MHWRMSFILNFCSTANDNAITEHTDTALCKKLKTTHPHDIVELNNYENASVDDKNLMCLVTFSQDTNSKQDEIVNDHVLLVKEPTKIRCSVMYASEPSQGVIALLVIFSATPANVHFSVIYARKPSHKK